MEETIKRLLFVAVALALATPAFSQPTTVTEYYVVQDTGTKKCTIVEKKPTEATILPILQVGPAFKTRIEAESGMKTIKVCTTN